jgi:hypothetical protein
MSGFIEGEDRHQATLFPERLDDYIAEDSPVRAVDVFVDDPDLSGLGFKTESEATGRPGYHPATLLKLFIYGYLNRVQSSRRLKREAPVAQAKSQRLEDKITALKKEMARLKKLEVRLPQAPDRQIALTDLDARCMATSGRGTGLVGYNVQAATSPTMTSTNARRVSA